MVTRLLHKVSRYGISRRVSTVIKSFLSGRSMKAVVNGQSSEVRYCWRPLRLFLQSYPLFILYIHYLPQDILRTSKYMYLNDTTVYRSTSECLDDKCWKLISLTSDLALTAQWGDNCFVSFNTSKMKLVTFHHHKADPEFTDEWYTFNEAPLPRTSTGVQVHSRPKIEIVYLCYR